MINRSELKDRAKNVLRGNYWLCLAVSAIVGAINQIVPQFTFRLNLFKESISLTDFIYSPEKAAMLSTGVAVLVLCMLLLNVAIGIFFFSPLNAGKNRFYIKAASGEGDIKSILDVFKSESYINVVKTLFMRDLRLILWSLCYIIPIAVFGALTVVREEFAYLMPLCLFGMIPMIMKHYSYYMTDYIIAENPGMNWRECIKTSEMMMKNVRFQTFVLELSFVGWALLGIICCGIGVLFVTPYIEATITQLYLDRKRTVNAYDFCYEEQ